MNDAGAAHGYDGFPPPVHRAEAPRMAEREPVVSIRDVSKTYATGFEALKPRAGLRVANIARARRVKETTMRSLRRRMGDLTCGLGGRTG